MFVLVGLICCPVDARTGTPNPVQPYLACFNSAGEKYWIDPLLLEAIARQESSLNPKAINRNRDGSADYGIMQMNSQHIPGLVREGLITGYRDLLDKPCLNIQIAARLLATHFQRCGVNWNCLGSFNAGFGSGEASYRRREFYANRVWPRYQRLLRERRGVTVQ